MKTCSECGAAKPTSEFGIARDRRDGLNNRCKPCNREQARAWRLNNKWRERLRALQRYGMTPEDYDRIFVEQGGRCAICGGVESGPRTVHLHVDHCHDTGHIRGLLCNNCNRGLGLLGDSMSSVLAALVYLVTTKKKEIHGTAD